MAIKNIIAKGIGFSPNQPDWIVTHGFGTGGIAGPDVPGLEYTAQPNRMHYTARPGAMHYTAQPNRMHYTARPD